MRISMSTDDITKVRNVIEDYRRVTSLLGDLQKQADEIQDKVINANSELNKIKENEDILMKYLHKTYGDFSLQDVYETINYGK